MAAEEEVTDKPLVLVVDKYFYSLGTVEGDQVLIVSKHFKTEDEALAEKVKREKKKP